MSEAVDRFDARAEAYVARFRGNRALDGIFYFASFIGDHGAIWVALAVVRFFTNIGGAEEAHFAGIRSVCSEAGQAIFVNGGVKSLFRRTRPVPDFDRPYHLRIPRTTSFPSGHATAAMVGSVLLAQGTGWGWFLFPLAAIVAFSRVYVRIHHMSDVIGGVIVGLVIAFAIAYFAPLP